MKKKKKKQKTLSNKEKYSHTLWKEYSVKLCK